MTDRFDDLPILAELGESLDVAFARQNDAPPVWWARLRAWVSRGGLPLLLLLGLGVGVSAAAATLLALRATVIPAPAARDLQAPMRAVPGTGRVSTATSPDPGGGPRWAVRTTRSATGLTCSSVGQLVGGAFGIVGLDGRFRVLPERIVDGCSAPVRGRATLLGVRVFDADAQADVRTVVSGVAGPTLRTVSVRTSGRPRDVAIGDGGIFVIALRGYPEDSAPVVDLRFADGSTQKRRFGAEPGIVRDPLGGPALQAELNRFSGRPQRCVRVYAARVGPDAPSGPNACVLPRRDAAFLAARRLGPGDRGVFGEGWDWHRGPRRTIAWGWTRRPARVLLLGAGPPQPLAPDADGTFVAILPVETDPRALSIRLEPRDGSMTRELRAGQGVVRTPRFGEERP